MPLPFFLFFIRGTQNHRFPQASAGWPRRRKQNILRGVRRRGAVVAAAASAQQSRALPPNRERSTHSGALSLGLQFRGERKKGKIQM